jgi:hypothetical protein
MMEGDGIDSAVSDRYFDASETLRNVDTDFNSTMTKISEEASLFDALNELGDHLFAQQLESK